MSVDAPKSTFSPHTERLHAGNRIPPCTSLHPALASAEEAVTASSTPISKSSKEIAMTHSTYPIVGVPVIRAERYPHVIGPDADPDGDIEAVEVTQLTVDSNSEIVGLVTLSAIADPNDAWGFAFDLEPADARELAKRLIEAASDTDSDGQTRSSRRARR
jgi:hypothetical protein